MSQIRTDAIICALKAHGENGGVVRLLTPDSGLLAGYVQGARGRENRPVLIPGNRVVADLRARGGSQLASLSCELVGSVGPWLGEPLAALGIDWITTLTAIALPEGHPYPRLYDALGGVLGAIVAAPAARAWVVPLLRYEQLLLAELGYGLVQSDMGSASGAWDSVLAALHESGSQLDRHILIDWRATIRPVRARLIARLTKAAG
ncbi:MAG: recombination protein O N-terminal domain-containing protein [Alphaproteobacteria bacterium]|nr:recombination protein O N-terminal domain-containing protein [Alphaproteobacteria bacterium]MDE2042265.1 recombination protein O N-terminal domain-containing protein [Alphaproteobacteria bacterium]MDE2341077.1 recombination protein O N-terminal domain-containing protein [Alphaproteobacteria bacterium]